METKPRSAQERMIIPTDRFKLVDALTGEIVEDHVLVVGKKPHMQDRNFVKFFVAFLQDLLDDKELYKGSLRLLLYAITRMDYNTLEITLDAHDAAKALNVSVQSIWAWKSLLLRKGYLEKIKDPTTNRTKYLRYKLRTYTAVKGQMAKVKLIETKTVTHVEQVMTQVEIEQS